LPVNRVADAKDSCEKDPPFRDRPSPDWLKGPAAFVGVMATGWTSSQLSDSTDLAACPLIAGAGTLPADGPPTPRCPPKRWSVDSLDARITELVAADADPRRGAGARSTFSEP